MANVSKQVREQYEGFSESDSNFDSFSQELSNDFDRSFAELTEDFDEFFDLSIDEFDSQSANELDGRILVDSLAINEKPNGKNNQAAFLLDSKSEQLEPNLKQSPEESLEEISSTNILNTQLVQALEPSFSELGFESDSELKNSAQESTDDLLIDFSLNFSVRPPSKSSDQATSLPQLWDNLKDDLSLAPITLIQGSIGTAALAARFFDTAIHTHRFWVNAYIHSFTDFAQWAIAYFTKSLSESQLAPLVPEHLLVDTLVNLLSDHSCFIAIEQIPEQTADRTPEQELWLEFLQTSFLSTQANSEPRASQIVATSISLEVLSSLTLDANSDQVNVIKLKEPLSKENGADLLQEMGILGDRHDLETFSQLVNGHPQALTLAANLLKSEEQIPQIRYLSRYGKRFDLNFDHNLAPITSDRHISVEYVLERSFKRLLPKHRYFLTIASIYSCSLNPRAFNLQDMHGLVAVGDVADLNKLDLDKLDLHKLEQLGLLQNLGQNYFYCDRTIANLIPITDAKPYHEQIIKYLWTKTKPYFEWESDQDVAEYLAIFDHCCALGEYYRGFYIIHEDDQKSLNQSVEQFLEREGKHFTRIRLFTPLYQAWQKIQSDRPEFGVVLMGLGDSYSALGKYDLAIPLYQQWLEILSKRRDPLERGAKAQCLYKLASVSFAVSTVEQNLPLILSHYQESLDIAVKSSDRPLELKNLLGLGNLYIRLNQPTQALEYYDRHLHLAQETQDIQAQIVGLPPMALAYKSVKQYERALEIYRSHLSLLSSDIERSPSLENLADIYQVLGEYTQAKGLYQQCLDCLDSSGLTLKSNLKPNQNSRGRCLIGLGITSDRLGTFKEAIAYYQQALEIFSEASEYYPQCLLNLANAHNSLGQYKEALGFYEKVLRLSLGSIGSESLTSDLKVTTTQGNRTLQVKSLIGLGNVHNSMGKYIKAMQFYEQAWETSKDIPDQQAIALGNLGNVYNAIGQYQEAMELYKQSLDLAKTVGDLPQQAHCLNQLGLVLDRLGYYSQALQFYQEWIDLKKTMGDRSASLISVTRDFNSPNSSLTSSKYTQAVEFHQQWLEVKRKMGDRHGEANSLGNLGNAYFALGQYPQAISSYQQCLEIARTIQDRRSEASSLSGLGSAFFALGQYTQAIEFHDRSLEISQKIADVVIQAKTLSNLGKAYYSLGQYGQAAQKYLQCLEIIQKIGNRQGEANVLGDLGNTHYALGKYPQAIDFYQQWLEISQEIGDRSQQGNALGGLGNSHNALGQYVKAIEFYRQWQQISQETLDRRSLANALAGLGNAHNSLGEYNLAIEFHQQSLKLQKENSDRFTDRNIWTNFLDTLENLEQKSLTANVPNPYLAIDVQSKQQTENTSQDRAIQQLVEASVVSKPSPSSKPSKSPKPPKPKNVSKSSNWLGSVFGWFTGK